MEYNFTTVVHKSLSDTTTPVELYLKLRDKFSNCLLLESSEHKRKENSYSYLCLEPIGAFIVNRDTTTIEYPCGKKDLLDTNSLSIPDALNEFTGRFTSTDLRLGFSSNGLFGYTSYDAITLFEDIELANKDFSLPLMQYHLFRFQIVFNHFNNEIYLLEHLLDGEFSRINSIIDIVFNRAVTQHKFMAEAGETSNFSDAEFLETIKNGIGHCLIGDVFQVVISRKFRQKFMGDEFNVYRALRSVNPSSYLFYFDYGSFKIFGSSPEAQLIIKDNKATIHPIAGTFRRTGNQAEDEWLAIALKNDPKENAEHVMLVDLARNDLSRNSSAVRVENYKQLEYYSHVIHMVSKVTATLNDGFNPIKIFGDSFPAGTLSGAPKYKAMKIIDDYEPESRGFYGGAVGIIGFDNSYNHAIFIRSLLSQNNQLTFQAGCGIVAKSNSNDELEEVNNKVMAVRKAIELANTL
jgi:anthranilate synthase component 1